MARLRPNALVLLGVLALHCAAATDFAFAPLKAPLTDAEKHQALSSATATFGTQVPLGLKILVRSGETKGAGSTPFGQLVSASGAVVYKQTAAAKSANPEVSNAPDFTSYLRSPDGKTYMVSQFESPQPSPIFISELSQDASTGEFSIVSSKPVNLSSIGGAWNLCAGQVTPWGTHLGGEEYEPDARLFEAATGLNNLPSNVIPYLRYWDKYQAEGLTLADVQALFKPYKYGQAVEVGVLAGGVPRATKHYVFGRSSKEMVYIMPDRKTAYITDDGTNDAMYKFVADSAGSLKSGTLYAAKFYQWDAEDGGTFSINWKKLGSATNAELAAKAETLKFSDIFAYAAPTSGTCPEGFKSVNTGDRLQECLQLKAGAEKWAAFFETRRYAALLGATTEFSKMEGITYSATRKKLYMAMSDIRYGMEDNKRRGVADTRYDIGGNNDIRLPGNPCGCIYELDVSPNYNAHTMRATICGSTTGMVDADNTCSVESIANPDNVSIMDKHNLLLIAEDSGTHATNMGWAYHLDTGILTRITTAPLGAEVTSIYYYQNITNFAYIMAASQHPSDLTTNPFNQGVAGYVGYYAFPAAAIAGKSIQFRNLPLPRTQETQAKLLGSSSLVAGITSKATYTTLYRSGRNIGGIRMGTLLDKSGRALKSLNSSMLPTADLEVSNSPDHTTLLQTCDALHLVQHYENTPGLVYAAPVVQSKSTGALSLKKPRVVDFSKWGGTWYSCAGTPTAWESHLGSEEYEPDAKNFGKAATIAEIQALPNDEGWAVISQMRYFGKYLPSMTINDIKTNFKPYNYGRVLEVFVDKTGCAKGVKHFAMGRGSIELAHVLGDGKTVLISEDGQNDAFYKFVADKAGDLSAGTLYAAKFTQKSASNGGTFDVSWIELGHGVDSELETKAATLTFTDLFEVAAPVSGACSEGFTSVNTGYAGQECLKLKPDTASVAPFLETRRFAAMKGASTEFNKAEGLTYDPVGKRVFLAVTSVEKGMEDNASKGSANTKFDIGHANDMKLPYNPCGCVYELALDDNFSPTSMKGLICGEKVNATLNYGNTCHLESIANPDNVDFVAGVDKGILFIGEDTSLHQNDVLWAYDLASGALTRILSTPYGSEITSPQFYRNINGFGYLLGVIQHPYGESDQAKVTEPMSSGSAAWTGYLGPFKGTGQKPDAFCNDGAGICGTPARKLRL